MSLSTGENNREAAALADALSNHDAQNGDHQRGPDMVPVHVVQSMRDEIRSLKESQEAYKNHFDMMRWQQQQPQMQQQPQNYNPFPDLEPDDSVPVRVAQKAIEDVERRFDSKIAELRIRSQANDYSEVLQKYLPAALSEDPELAADIRSSSNPYKTAYNAIKASRAYQQDLINKSRSNDTHHAPPKPDQDAEKIVKNAKQSGNLASVSNNAHTSGSYPSFSQMSDEEFRAYKSRTVSGGHRTR